MTVRETGIGSCKVKVEKTAYGDILCSFRKTGNRGPAGDPENSQGSKRRVLTTASWKDGRTLSVLGNKQQETSRQTTILDKPSITRHTK